MVINFWWFFFSSRRRHTRLQGDWSSDVCSSDLAQGPGPTGMKEPPLVAPQEDFADAAQVFDVSARANLVKVERCRPAFAKARLNPVDGAGVAIKARPHRQ